MPSSSSQQPNQQEYYQQYYQQQPEPFESEPAGESATPTGDVSDSYRLRQSSKDFGRCIVADHCDVECAGIEKCIALHARRNADRTSAFVRVPVEIAGEERPLRIAGLNLIAAHG